MIDIFLFAITGIIAFAGYWILRGRDGKVFPLVRQWLLACTIVAAGSAIKGDAYSLPQLLLAGAIVQFLIFYLILNVLAKVGIHFNFGGSDADASGAGGDHIRGAKLVNGKQLQKILKNETGDLTIGEQRIPERLEALHFLIAGATGVGKSVAISEMLDSIAQRGDRVFLADAGGNYLKAYFNADRGDLILNPLDARAVGWSPLAEMEGVWDADQIAKSIIPDGEGSSTEWNQYAQVITSAILKHCWQNKLTNTDIFRIAIIADVTELREIFAGTPAQPLVAEGNERMFGNVRGIIGTKISPFQYLDPAAGANNGFSLKSVIQDDNAQNWLFFNFRDDQLSTLAPIIAAMTDIISKSILSMEADANRKFWLILDEFASLGRISSILDFLTKARKNGGRAVIGVQTVSQLKSAYGMADASTLLANCSSQVVFRVPDPETADIMSRMLGDQQISRIIQSGGESSQSMQVGGSKSENWSQQITTERVILPSQLQNMETLNAILNLAGDIPAAPILLEPRDRAKVAETFQKAKREAIKIAAPAKAAETQEPTETQSTVSESDLPGIESNDVI